MSGIGEIPVRSTMAGYYHLEDVNDASGNGRTLTNTGGTTFTTGKFNNSANFGNAGGGGKYLYLSANPFSALKIPNATISFWLKLNNSGNAAAGMYRLFGISTTTGAVTNGWTMDVYMGISSGVFSIYLISYLSSSNIIIPATIIGNANTTSWYNIIIVKTSTTTIDVYCNSKKIATSTGSGTDVSISGATKTLSIGNAYINGYQVPPKLQPKTPNLVEST